MLPPPPPLVLALGDSLVAGYGLAPADGFTGQLQRRLRITHAGADVVDGGMSGDTVADVLRRLPRLLSGLARRPDLAIVQAGPNDVLQRMPPARTRQALDAILTELGYCGMPVLLTTVAPPPVLADRAAAYLGIHAELAARHAATSRPFFPPGVLGCPGMMLADGFHPNARAIALVVDALLPTIVSLLEADRSDRTIQNMA